MKVLVKATSIKVNGKVYPRGINEVEDKKDIAKFEEFQNKYRDCVVDYQLTKEEKKKEEAKKEAADSKSSAKKEASKKEDEDDNAENRAKLIEQLEKAGKRAGKDFDPAASEGELKKLLNSK